MMALEQLIEPNMHDDKRFATIILPVIRRCLPLSFALMCLLWTTAVVSAQPTSDAPFIYYHSREDNAFIIERTDGTDRRILAEFTLPDENSFIDGPGWSPSGEWFAWTIGSISGNYAGSPIFIVHRDGGEPIALVEQPDSDFQTLSIMDIYWSPTDDILLVRHVFEQSEDNDSIGGSQELFLYDAQQQTRITSIDFRFSYAEWTPDGQNVVFYNYDSRTDISTMTLHSINGYIEEREYSMENCSGTFPYWSPDGKVAYMTPESQQLIIENFSFGEVATLAESTEIVRYIDWSPNGENALVYTTDDWRCETHELWFLSLPDQTLIHLSDNQRFILPESHQGSRWDHIFHSHQFLPTTAWSPDGTLAVVTEANNATYLLTLSPFDFWQIALPENDHIGTIRWSQNSNRIYVDMNQPEASLIKYDLATGMIETLLRPSELNTLSRIEFYALSQDETLLAFRINNNFNVQDLTTGDRRALPFLDDGPPNGLLFGAEAFWHPTQEWLMLLSTSTSVFFRHLDVVHVDGGVQRNLGWCSETLSCFGWLPEVGQ